MTLQIDTKKPLNQYTEAEQQAILSLGQAILAQKLEQGEYHTKEETWCMIAYQRTQREVRSKPTVEKIVKEKPLTKAQKVEILEKYTSGVLTELSEKEQAVIDELVGVNKEYYIFTLHDGSKELMKLGKINIKKKVKELQANQANIVQSSQTNLCMGVAVQVAKSKLTQSEQEFLTAMTNRVIL